MDENDAELVEVYSAADIAEAHFLQSMLEDAGIKARVVGDTLSGLPPLGEVVAPRVWVFQSDEAVAKELLVEFERVHRRPHLDAEDDRPAETWTCPTCGEAVEADFELCWNCQTPRKPY